MRRACVLRLPGARDVPVSGAPGRTEEPHATTRPAMPQHRIGPYRPRGSKGRQTHSVLRATIDFPNKRQSPGRAISCRDWSEKAFLQLCD